MINKADQTRWIVQYLLGDLSAGDRAEFEDLYLNDTAVFQELVAVENDMVDQYLLGELSPSTREKFEKSYMNNPVRRETVEAARSLLAYSATEAAASQTLLNTKRRWLRSWVARAAAAAALILMTGGLAWLIWTNRRLEGEIQRLGRDRTNLVQENQTLQRQADRLRADLREREDALQLQLPDTVVLTLGMGTSRGQGELENLVVPARISFILLRVMIEDTSHSVHTLSIRTVDGSLVWRKTNIPSALTRTNAGTVIMATFPSRLLREGDYIARVSADGDDLGHALAGYSFHVVKR